MLLSDGVIFLQSLVEPYFPLTTSSRTRSSPGTQPSRNELTIPMRVLSSLRSHSPNLLPSTSTGPPRRPSVPVEHAHQGGLTGAVGPDHRPALASPDAPAEVLSAPSSPRTRPSRASR